MRRWVVLGLATALVGAVGGCSGEDPAPAGAGGSGATVGQGGQGAQGGATTTSTSTGGMGGMGGGGMGPVCGDGVLEGDEACDDGNTAADDGCDASCDSEPGWNCDGASPTVCAEICGDGLVVGSEGCDDAGTEAGDGCDDACQVELGWSCADEPSVCMTGCGDGIVAGTEECDDGAMVDGDGCSAACAVEDGWICTGTQPTVCELIGSCTNPVVVTGDGFTWQAPNLIPYGDDLDNQDASCIGNDGDPGLHPDVVFEVSLAAGETLRVTDSGSLDVLFHVLDGACSSASACLASYDGSNSAETSTGIVYQAAVAETVFVVIDTYFENPSSTDDVNLLFEISSCGDGLVGPGEGCDDGNATPGDGCSDLCAVESNFECSGEPSVCVALPAASCADPIQVTALPYQFADTNIQKYGNDENFSVPSSCQNVSTTNGGYDLVFAVPLVFNETLFVSEHGSLDSVLHILTPGQCGSGVECVASSDSAESSGISYTAAGAETVYVVLESWGNPSAGTTFNLQLDSSICGDGIVDATEECDDGGVTPGDGCAPDCTVETGYECSGQPSLCDPLPAASCAEPIQVTSVPFQFSGTNIQKYGNDENFSVPASCGNVNSTNGGYDVVFAVSLVANETLFVSEHGSLDSVLHILTPGQCGSGVACEESSDGAEATGLTYTAAGAETVYVVLESYGNPSASTTFDLRINTALCGDGLIEGGEQCDDGGVTPGDGCSDTCTLEANTQCQGEPSVCGPVTASDCSTPILVTGPSFKFAGSNIAQYGDNHQFNGPPGCATTNSGTVPELIFEVSLLAGETIRVRETGSLDAVVNILEPGVCASGAACSAAYDYQEEEGVFYTAQANEVVYVALASWSSSPTATDTFHLQIDWVSDCGDSVVEAHEQCDDGNLVDGDGCSSICMPEASTLLTGCTGTIVTGVATPMPTGIPNNNSSGGAILSIPIAATGTIQSMAMAFTAQHTQTQDIDLWLEGPNGGGERDVSTDNGTNGAGYIGTLFQDGGAPVTSGSPPFTGVYAPEEPFSFFDGQSVNGTWTIRVADDSGTFEHGTVGQVDLAFCVTP